MTLRFIFTILTGLIWGAAAFLAGVDGLTIIIGAGLIGLVGSYRPPRGRRRFRTWRAVSPARMP